MRFVCIVASSLVSGSYYNGGGASDIKFWRLAYLDDIQFAPHGKHPVLGVKTTVSSRSTCDVSGCLLWDSE